MSNSKKNVKSSSSSKNTRGTSKSKTTSTRSRKNKKTFANDLMGGFSVVFGVILFIFLKFEKIGVFAELVKSILFGFLGYAAYVIPVALVIIGIAVIANEEKMKISTQNLKGFLVASFLASTISCFLSSNVNDFNMFSNFVEYIVNAFNTGTSGIIGAILAGISVKLLGIIGARIFTIFVTFIVTLCSFNMSFAQFFEHICNIFSTIAGVFSSMLEILFRDDQVERKDKEEKVKLKEEQKSARSRKVPEQVNDDIEEVRYEQRRSPLVKLKVKKKQLIDFDSDEALSNHVDEKSADVISEEVKRKMEEKGSTNFDENLNLDRAEQVEFDFTKLNGGKLTEEQLQKKQQRDEFFKKQKEQKEDTSIKEVLTIDHAITHEEEDNYVFPPVDLLAKPKATATFDKNAIQAVAIKLQKTLASFGVEARVTDVTKGPTVTRYELAPSTGVKVSKIVNLADDIALNLAAKSIRIEAPIPGKAAVGIEVPNTVSESVFLREVIESKAFKDHSSKIGFALGKDAAGDVIIADIAKMPHVLVAGATGSGKSVCINSIIISILYKAKPSEVKLILIDPKMVELSGYNGIPHLLIPVVTDPKKAAGALNWAVQEMVNRYSLFASKGVKDIKGYNKVMEKEGLAKLPQIVIIIDELADLMMVAPNDVEDAICRLAQMARAAGMHLVIATQRPSVDVITGIIKANIPSRIAFTVSSQVDSRTILDSAGAEKLLGKGDMLYFPVGETKPLRVQGAFVSESEIEKIVEHIKSNCEDTTYSDDIIKSIENSSVLTGKSKSKGNQDEASKEDDDSDVLLNDAIDLVIDMGSASASMLQRKFKIGYSRAGRIIDQMEERGLISGYDGSKPRQVLVSKAEWQQLKMGNLDATSNDFENNTSSGATDTVNNTTAASSENYGSTNLALEEVRRLDKDNREKYNLDL